jgi:translation initiation factor 1
MPDICPKCGLPKDICVCDILDRETLKKIRIHSEKRKFRKHITFIEGLTGDEIEKTARELKRMLAVGGTYKNGIIELQGNNKEGVRKALLSLGYSEENLDIAD